MAGREPPPDPELDSLIAELAGDLPEGVFIDRRSGTDAALRALVIAARRSHRAQVETEERVLRLARRVVIAMGLFGVTVTLALAGGGYLDHQNTQRVHDIQVARKQGLRATCMQSNAIRAVARELLGSHLSETPPHVQRALRKVDCGQFVQQGLGTRKADGSG